MSDTATTEVYEHTDLVLETCIALLNDPQMKSRAERRDSQVVWVYRWSDELEAFLEMYDAGNHMVEPVAFSKMLRTTRNAVYNLMGYDPPRLAHSAKPAT